MMTRNDSSKTMSDPSKLNLIVGVLPNMVKGAPCGPLKPLFWKLVPVVVEVS